MQIYEDNEQALAFADRLIEEINQAKREIDQLVKVAKWRKIAFAARMDKEVELGTKELQQEIEEKTAMLKPIIEKQLEGKDKKSIKLLSGSAGFKKVAPSFSFNGEEINGKSDQLLQLVKSHNLDFVITSEYVDWASLKQSLTVTDDNKVVTKDGEILSEITVKVEPDKFFVKPLK